MKHTQVVTWGGCILAILLVGSQVVSGQNFEPDEHGFIVAQPADLMPSEGARTVNIYGNPREPGLYVIRITFAPGSGSRPHFHDQARFITVIKGKWWVSIGPEADVYDPENMSSVEAGSFLYEPPNGHHYDMAKDEEVIVQIMGMGPVKTTRIE